MSRFDKLGQRANRIINDRFGDLTDWHQEGFRPQRLKVALQYDPGDFDSGPVHETSRIGIVPRDALQARPQQGERVTLLEGQWRGEYRVDQVIDESAYSYRVAFKGPLNA